MRVENSTCFFNLRCKTPPSLLPTLSLSSLSSALPIFLFHPWASVDAACSICLTPICPPLGIDRCPKAAQPAPAPAPSFAYWSPINLSVVSMEVTSRWLVSRQRRAGEARGKASLIAILLRNWIAFAWLESSHCATSKHFHRQSISYQPHHNSQSQHRLRDPKTSPWSIRSRAIGRDAGNQLQHPQCQQGIRGYHHPALWSQSPRLHFHLTFDQLTQSSGLLDYFVCKNSGHPYRRWRRGEACVYSEARQESGDDGDVEMEPRVPMCLQHWCPWVWKCAD